MADAAPTTLNVSLPEKLKAFVEAEVARRGYGSSSEYMRELIRGAMSERAEEVIDEKLLEGFRGVPREITDEEWDRRIAAAEREAAQHPKSRGRSGASGPQESGESREAKQR